MVPELGSGLVVPMLLVVVVEAGSLREFPLRTVHGLGKKVVGRVRTVVFCCYWPWFGVGQ